MPNTDLVIFDCDGVLVDSEAISGRVLGDALTRVGLPTTPEEARRDYLGPRLAEVAAIAEERLGRALDDDWLAQFERDRAEAFRGALFPIPGVADAVTRIVDAGVGVCVASQARLEKTRLSLTLTRLVDLFPDGAVFSAEQVARGKPHPDLFLHAAEVVGVPPARCTVVEDSVRGIEAATAAGMRPLGFAAGEAADGLRAAGAETFTSMEQLPRLLEVS